MIKRHESLYRKFIKWIIKRCLLILDKDNDLLILGINTKDENKDYTIIVNRYFNEYWTHGANRYYYEEKDKTE